MSEAAASIKLVNAQTYHGRHGAITNTFRYKFDAILVPVSEMAVMPDTGTKLDRLGLFSFHQKDHGDGGKLSAYAADIARTYGFERICDGKTSLLTQPRFLGYVFNPVSFWFYHDRAGALRVVLVEVNNTFGERHSYLCHHSDFSEIKKSDTLQSHKIFHVSPFQDVSGRYEFRFHHDPDKVGAWIDFKNGSEGVYATVTGNIRPLTTRALVKSALVKPFGAFRVIALIHWQALKLKLKGGRYRPVPKQNTQRISR